jgi:hypothetical protein
MSRKKSTESRRDVFLPHFGGPFGSFRHSIQLSKGDVDPRTERQRIARHRVFEPFNGVHSRACQEFENGHGDGLDDAHVAANHEPTILKIVHRQLVYIIPHAWSPQHDRTGPYLQQEARIAADDLSLRRGEFEWLTG